MACFKNFLTLRKHSFRVLFYFIALIPEDSRSDIKVLQWNKELTSFRDSNQLLTRRIFDVLNLPSNLVVFIYLFLLILFFDVSNIPSAFLITKGLPPFFRDNSIVFLHFHAKKNRDVFQWKIFSPFAKTKKKTKRNTKKLSHFWVSPKTRQQSGKKGCYFVCLIFSPTPSMSCPPPNGNHLWQMAKLFFFLGVPCRCW